MLTWTLCFWDNCNGNYPRADFWRPGWLPSVTSVGHCPGREVLPPGFLGFLWMSVEVALRFLLGTCTPWPTPAPSAHKELWVLRTTSNKPVPLVAFLKGRAMGHGSFHPSTFPKENPPYPCKGKNKWISIFKESAPPLSILTGTMSGALRQSYGQGLIPINSMEKAVDAKEYCHMSYLLLLTLW